MSKEFLGLDTEYEVLSDKPNVAKLKAIGLAEGVWNGVLYPAEELAKANIKHLIGSPLTIDHSKSLKDVVGVVKNAYFDPAAGLIVEGEIHDEGLLRKIKAGLKPGISMELFRTVEYNRKERKSIARDIEFRRASLVLDPACKKDVCNVNITLSEDEIYDIASALYETLYKKSDLPFMTKDGRIRGGFKGCLKMIKSSRGISDDRLAGAICARIWARKGGSGKGKGQKAHRKKSPQQVKGKAAESDSAEPLTLDELAEIVREAYRDVAENRVDSVSLYNCEEEMKEAEFRRIDELAKYPWEQCIRDQMKRYGDKEKAQKICAAIKNRTVQHAIEFGHADTVEEAIDFVLSKAEEDKLFDYVLNRLVEYSQDSQDGDEAMGDCTESIEKLEEKYREEIARLQEELDKYVKAEQARKDELFEKIREIDPSAPESLRDNEVSELEYLLNKLVAASEPVRHSIPDTSETKEPDKFETLSQKLGVKVDIVE